MFSSNCWSLYSEGDPTGEACVPLHGQPRGLPLQHLPHQAQPIHRTQELGTRQLFSMLDNDNASTNRALMTFKNMKNGVVPTNKCTVGIMQYNNQHLFDL